MNENLTQDEVVALKKLIQKLGVEDALPQVVKDQLDAEELCENCGLPIHPCLPCSEVWQFYNHVDSEYAHLLRLILKDGRRKKNRTGVDTIGVFGAQAKFDVDLDAFPVLTTKKIYLRSIIHELLWFIRGDTNIKYLADNDVHIWDDWAYVRYIKEPRNHGVSDMVDHGHNTWKPLTQTEFIHRIKVDNKFADKWGELGEGTYGGMWRDFPHFKQTYKSPTKCGVGDEYEREGVDQLKKVVDKLKTNPDDRRIIVSAWHPYWVDHCALPPCHCLFHFNTEELTHQERMHLLTMKWGHCDFGPGVMKTEAESTVILDKEGIPTRRLNCLLYQRSCDTFLGVPFNITSYCLLTAMIAHCTNMVPGTFTHTYGDLHLYVNHLDQVKEQLSRDPKILPKLWLNPKVRNLFDFKFEDIEVRDYVSHPAIKGDIAV